MPIREMYAKLKEKKIELWFLWLITLEPEKLPKLRKDEMSSTL